MNVFKICIILIFSIGIGSLHAQNRKGIISGSIVNIENETIEFAFVSLKNTIHGTNADEKGEFSFSAPGGTHSLTVSALGYKTIEKQIALKPEEELSLNFIMESDATTLNEVLVTGKSSVKKINELAYNVVAIDAKPLHNSTLDLSHALDRISGVRVRETGGVGSSYNFSLNGFTGRQVKFFIDGIPMENFGSSFQINNIPINLAERIEVYKGVVPISFGADALGGAVNIVTSDKQNTFIDASYSYGSFNTHRSYINAGYTDKSGFTIQLNAFQNSSDNDYKVEVDVADINTGEYTLRKVKRFHDKYDNKTVILETGIRNKKYADKLLFGITYGKNRADIQTAARMDRVFGARFRRGEIIMPSLKYVKHDLFTKNLDFSFSANYNLGYEQVVDTVARQYNWLGEYIEKPRPGSELSRTMSKYKNNNGISTANLSYKISDKHTLTINHVYNTFNRKIKDELNLDKESNKQPRKTIKNVAGIGYRFDFNEKWNTSVFVKYFDQKTSSFVTVEGSSGWGTTEFKEFKNTFSALGYGLASTYFVSDKIQLKASFEKSYRLPENEELFGDEASNLEANIDLKPESSQNYNLGINFNTTIDRVHLFILDGSFIYRNAKDYIRPRQNTNGTHQLMENQRDVRNIGFNGEVKYSFKKFLTLGTNFTWQNLRNMTKYENGSKSVSTVYRDRIPNMPYLFGNANLGLFFKDVLTKKDVITLGYNLLYVHEYYLRWPSAGTSSDKLNIPTQISHDVILTYTLKEGRYNISMECQNIADSNQYDNFSLQKPGRNFSVKLRYFLSK